jgi:hypothetical protein
LGDFGFAIPENIAKNMDFSPQARKQPVSQKQGIIAKQLARIQQHFRHLFKACKKDSLYAEREDFAK